MVCQSFVSSWVLMDRNVKLSENEFKTVDDKKARKWHKETNKTGWRPRKELATLQQWEVSAGFSTRRTCPVKMQVPFAEHLFRKGAAGGNKQLGLGQCLWSPCCWEYLWDFSHMPFLTQSSGQTSGALCSSWGLPRLSFPLHHQAHLRLLLGWWHQFWGWGWKISA